MSSLSGAEFAVPAKPRRGNTLAGLACYMARTLQWMDELLGAASDGVVDRYVNRLVAMSGELPPPPTARPVAALHRLLRGARRLRTLAVSLGRGLMRLPILVEQFWILRRSRPPRAAVAFGVASNRLPLCAQGSVRENLVLMTRPLERSKQAFACEIADAGAIVLFDPLLASDYWRRRRRCWKENVLIADGMFLGVFAVLSFLAQPRRAAARMARLFQASWKEARRMDRLPRRGALWIALTCAIAGYGYLGLLGGSRKCSGILLTRNSTLLELLRAYLVWAPRCHSVCEIMHGMPGEHDAEFFERFLEAGEEFASREKHSFAPQVPGLPVSGMFRRKPGFREEMAINPRLNLLLAEAAATAADIAEAAVAERLRLAGRRPPAQRPPVLVSLFGTDRLTGRLERSATFRAECLLLALFRRASDELGIPCALVYLPHPSGATPSQEHPALQRNDVRIGGSSLMAWLISDLAVSLYSSALFEAAYFGRRAFTPLVAPDRLFAPYLDGVSHPASSRFEDLERGVKQALRRCAADSMEPLHQEVRRRLRRMGMASGSPQSVGM